MKEKLEDILDICLARIRQGVSVEDCLKGYPESADKLKGLLQLAKGIRNVPKPVPAKEGIASCLVRLGEALASRKRTSIFQKFRWIYSPQPALARAFVLVIILIFISWGTVNLSAHSIPGDLLYPVKLITEKVKFFLTVTPQGKVELRLTFSKERLQELVKDLEGKKELNTRLLRAMLDEATLALEGISNLPEAERRVYISRLEHLSAYHKDILENLKVQVPSSQRKELDNAIQMCEDRMQQMMKMKRQHMPMGRRSLHHDM